jgi:ADP-heptose:LPS heptosyltransferase
MGPLERKLLTVSATAAVALERLLRPATKPGPDPVKSVLVLEYYIPLGTCVHMTPLFEAIKRERPETTVTVATWGIGASVLRNSPYVDHLLETPDALKDFRGALTSLKKQLKARGLKPECCLTGAFDQRTKIGIFAALACNGWRGGLTLLSALYQRPLTYDKNISLIANNMRLAHLIGISGEAPEPKVFYTSQDAAVARKLVESARSGSRPVLVVISRNSGGLPTAWHEERWAETIRYAHRVLGYSILYVGSAAEAPALAALKAQADDIGTSLAGATSVNQLAAVIALSDMVITIATGGLHVARAVGTPMVVLGLAWEKPLEWLTEGRGSMRILRGPDVEKATPGYRLDDISVEWATAELAEMTRLFPPDEAAREARLKASLSDIVHLRR